MALSAACGQNKAVMSVIKRENKPAGEHADQCEQVMRSCDEVSYLQWSVGRFEDEPTGRRGHVHLVPPW